MTILGYALALLIGLSLGMLGGGGAILTVPVLHYVLGFGVKAAVPMSLVVVGLTSGFGAIQQARTGGVNVRAAIAFGPPAVVGALIGAELGLRVSAGAQLVVFGVVMLLAALAMFLGPVSAERSAQQPAARPLPLVTLIGAGVGMLTGFIGVGGGFLYVPALVVLGRLPMRQAVGTSLVLILLSCAASFLRYQGTLALDWKTILIFTLIAFVGVIAGGRLARRVSALTLRKGFAVFLLLTSVFVLLRGR